MSEHQTYFCKPCDKHKRRHDEDEDENKEPQLMDEEHIKKKTKREEKSALRVMRISDKAIIPTRGSKEAAGYDLYSVEEITIPVGKTACIDIGIALGIPKDHYGRIAERSGLALKHSITVGGGVIDRDYRGPIKVILHNHGKEDLSVKIGDRIAQLILERITTPDVVEVETLEDTERGDNGFGSTG